MTWTEASLVLLVSCAPALDEVGADLDSDGVSGSADCAPEDPAIHPGADEGCDGIDTDCDGELGAEERDGDEDGSMVCLDCDDEDAAVHAGAEDICNRREDDCDGQVDEDADWDGSHAAPLEGVLTVEDAWLTIVPGEGYPIIEGTSIAEVVGPGDVNGDGFDDLLIAGGSGPAFLFYAPFCHGTLELGEADVRLDLPNGGSWFIRRIFEVGDLNGDGFDDVQVDSWVWYGPLDGDRSWEEADLLIVPGHNMVEIAALAAGDWNGDGFGDLALGANGAGGWPPTDEAVCGCPEEDCEINNCYVPADLGTGQVAIMLGPIEGDVLDTADAAAWLVGEVGRTAAGRSVGNAGDVNGDGMDDVVVGAPGFGNSGPGPMVGAAYLAVSPFDGVLYLADAHGRWEGTDPGEQVGRMVGPAGDMTADGVPDVLLGGRSSDPYLVSGATPPGHYFLDVDVLRAFVGLWSIAIAGGGDFDGDGRADYIVGHDTRAMLCLACDAVEEDPAMWVPRFDSTMIFQGDPGWFTLRGNGAEVVGDSNGDGFTDFALVGETNFSDYQVVLFLGRGPAD